MLFVCAYDAKRRMHQFRVPQVRVANLGFSEHKLGSGRKYL